MVVMIADFFASSDFGSIMYPDLTKDLLGYLALSLVSAVAGL